MEKKKRIMEEKRLKINIELHVVGDGRTFLNYWNNINGDDVVAELIDGELYMNVHYKKSDVVAKNKISLQEYVNMIKEKFQ